MGAAGYIIMSIIFWIGIFTEDYTIWDGIWDQVGILEYLMLPLCFIGILFLLRELGEMLRMESQTRALWWLLNLAVILSPLLSLIGRIWDSPMGSFTSLVLYTASDMLRVLYPLLLVPFILSLISLTRERDGDEFY